MHWRLQQLGGLGVPLLKVHMHCPGDWLWGEVLTSSAPPVDELVQVDKALLLFSYVLWKMR